jgi:hypothetical protein
VLFQPMHDIIGNSVPFFFPLVLHEVRAQAFVRL